MPAKGEQNMDRDDEKGVQDSYEPSVAGQPNREAAVASREEILQKALELANLFASSSEVDFFRRAEQQIDGNTHVQQLIKAIKKKQKEIVGFEAFGNKDMTAAIEAEIAGLQEEMDNIPIVQEYQQSQSEINYLLQEVIGAVRDTVSAKIDLEKE